MKNRKAAQIAAFFVAAAIALFLLIPLSAGNWIRFAPALFHELENLGHPVAFAILGSIALRLYGAPPLFVIVSLTALGAGLELLQGMTGRDPSFQDVIGNALGAGIAVCLHARWQLRVPRQIALVALCLVSLVPLGWTLAAYGNRGRKAPLIWQADSRLFRRFSVTTSGNYPGLTVEEPLRDWRNWDELLVRIDNPHSQSVHVVVSMHDWGHNLYVDRYNGDFILPESRTTTLRIDLHKASQLRSGRTIDLSNVSAVQVYQVAELAEPSPDVREIRLIHREAE